MGRWKLLVKRETGDLVSVGTVLAGDAAERFDVIDAGEERPDQGDVQWDRQSRSFVPRPARILIDRLDDIEARLLADEDWQDAFASLTVARRLRLRAGLRRILVALLADRRYRDGEEAEAL